MNLFLVENDRSLPGLLNGPNYLAGRDVILCFNYLPFLRLRSQAGGHDFHFTEELLLSDDYGELHAAVDRFSGVWYKDGDIDRTLFEGVSLGEAAQISLSRTYMLSVLVKYGELIRRAKERWPSISRIYHDFSDQSNYFFAYEDDTKRIFDKAKLVELVGRQLSLDVVRLVCPQPIPSVLIARSDPDDARQCPKEWTARLRALAAAGIREAVVMLSKLRSRSVRRSRNGIYFFYYHNARSVTSSRASELILPSGSIVSLGWRALSLIAKGARFLDLDDAQYSESPERAEFVGRLKAWVSSEGFRGKAAERFEFNGITYADLFMAAIEDVVQTLIPRLLKYESQARSAIEEFGIGWFLLDEDLTEYQRVLIRVCELAGAKSVFLDHGIQGHRHAQKVCDRGGCDLVMCSGSFYESYYRSQERKPREYVTVGSPSMDPFAGARSRTRGRISRVMFLTFEDNFYARLDRFPWQERYAAEILPVVDKLLAAGIEVHYKPHFENRAYHRYLFDFFGVDERRINYIERGEFARLVGGVDLVVCNVTTCFYEGLASRTPTVFFEPSFNPGALLPPLSISQPDEITRFSTGDELWAFIEKYKDDTGPLHRFVDAFLRDKAGSYMGPLDGKSGRRVLEALRWAETRPSARAA